MKVIGVTGSSGSGKSTVSEIVQKELKAKIIVADKIVKKLQKPGNSYLDEIVNLLGKDCLKKNGYLNRRKVANIVFNNKSLRDKLNKLTKKYVVIEIKKQIKESKQKYVVLDVPLLIESGLNKKCNLVIGVISKKEEQIKRICKRDKLTKEEALSRLNIQPDNEFYKNNVDYIVENNGGEYDKLLGRIRNILQEL